MLTPQQLQEISFEKVRFGGYDMGSVDELLEPLTEDYVTLYKENSVLKSKMRILVEKLEEYRRQEASVQTAILTAQKTCDQMVQEAEKKCAQMLHQAQETAQAKSQDLDTEKERLEVAQEATAKFIDGMEKRLKRQLELLTELREAELPSKAVKAARREEPVNRAFDFDKEPSAPSPEEKADAFIEEIGASVEAAMAEREAQKEHRAPDPMTDTLHGELSPAKQKLLNELRFGHNGQ